MVLVSMNVKYMTLSILLWLPCRIEAQNVSFHTLSVETGLSNNFVKTIFKDSRGFIWIGTLEGLDRYDGVSLKSYIVDSTKSSVNDLAQTSDDFLWVATENGLWKLYDETFQFEQVLTGSDFRALSLAKDGNNNLLVGTDCGLYVMSNTTTLHFLLDSSNLRSPSNIITGIVSDGLFSCWISTLSGLFRCDYSSGEPRISTYHAHSESYNSFSGIAKIGNCIYLGTKTQGLIKFDVPSKQLTPYIDVGNKFILHVSSDGADRLFIGTDGNGLKIISVKDNTVTASFEYNSQDPSSIRSNAVYSFLETDGILWVGAYSTGLSYSQQKLFHVYTLGNVISTRDRQIRSFAFDKATQTKILGTRDGLIVIDEKNGEAAHIRRQNNPFLRANIILSIFPFENNYLIGTYGGGVSVYNPTTRIISDFRDESVFQQGCFYGFSADANNNLWFATLEGVYCYFSTGELKQFTTANSSLCGNEVYAVKADSKGRVWFGLAQGLCFFDPTTNDFRPSTDAHLSLKINTKVTSIYEDKNDNVWFCTEKDGLYSLNSDLGSIKHFSTDGFLPDNSTNSIVEDGQGYYWVALNKGLARCSFNNEQIRLFGLSDGLPGLMFNPNACFFDIYENKLWWGSEKGLVCCQPDRMDNAVSSQPVRLTSFHINGNEVVSGKGSPLLQSIDRCTQIRLNHLQKNIRFGFVALNYVFPNSNIFDVYLSGFEKTWTTLNKGQSEVSYNNLKPGKYIFHIRLSGQPNTERSVIIVIQRPWYTYAALLSVILVVITWLLGRLWRRRLLDPEADAKQEHDDDTKKLPTKPSIQAVRKNETIQKALTTLMEEKKPYLKPDLKVTDLATMLHCQPYELSKFLHATHHNYSDFVNRYRVDEFMRRCHLQENRKYTLTALSEQCGFSSRASFFRIFKKITGRTPAEYLQNSGICNL